MTERTGLMQFMGKDAPILGPDISVGQTAPEFSAHSLTWEVESILASTAGKVRIIASVPSLETSVCDRETRRFNQEAANLSKEISIIVVSADLPYTQKRWCGAAGIDQVKVVSDHLNLEFGLKYGCLMKDQRILRRAIFIVGRDDKIIYAAYMPAMGVEPDYEVILEAARTAINNTR